MGSGGHHFSLINTAEKTNDIYYEMFEDEAHVLIVLSIIAHLGIKSVEYYYIGNEALKVIDELDVCQMFENIGNSRSLKGERWKEEIINIANLVN